MRVRQLLLHQVDQTASSPPITTTLANSFHNGARTVPSTAAADADCPGYHCNDLGRVRSQNFQPAVSTLAGVQFSLGDSE